MLSEVGFRRTSNRAKRENSERWLLTYADLITLLLAFFVIMYGMSSADVQKFSKLTASMQKAFNVGVLEGAQTPGVVEQPGIQSGSAEMLENEDQSLEMIYSEMGWISEQEGLADKVSFTLRPEGIAISLAGNLLFASGRADLRPDSVRLLHSVAAVLAKVRNGVRIEGHTDDVAPSGTEFPSNWELSGARAVAVVRYLAEVEGVDPGRLSAAAFSQYQPVSSNADARTRARNRRSEILILYPATTKVEETSPQHAGVAPAAAERGENRGAVQR